MDLSVFYVPGGGNNNLPNICYVRVRSSSSGFERFLATSRRSSAGRFFASNGRIRPNQEACLAFLCPKGTGQSSLRVIASDRRCSYQQNPYLSASRSRFSHVYFQSLSAGDISEKNGLYTSGGSCRRGSATAVTFNCPSQSTSKQSADTDVDEGSNKSEEEIAGLVDPDVLKEIKEESSSATDNNLASLMSNLLQQLKDKKATTKAAVSEHAHKMDSKKSEDVSDETLVSELEKVLQKV